VDVAAACAASMATSLLEGPMEMFRHRMQARALHLDGHMSIDSYPQASSSAWGSSLACTR
jgi:hypothetical protein